MRRNAWEGEVEGGVPLICIFVFINLMRRKEEEERMVLSRILSFFINLIPMDKEPKLK